MPKGGTSYIQSATLGKFQTLVLFGQEKDG